MEAKSPIPSKPRFGTYCHDCDLWFPDGRLPSCPRNREHRIERGPLPSEKQGE